MFAAQSESSSHIILPKPQSISSFVSEWLLDNFEYAENSHIAREALFKQYSDYAEQHGRQFINSASFGKIIRAVFPHISTRRLGTRGNSKSKHDPALSVESRPPVKKVRSALEVQLNLARDMNSTAAAVTMTTATGAMIRRDPPSVEFVQDLLRFPSVDYARLPVELDSHKISQFLGTYRNHNESLLRFGLQGNFEAFGAMIAEFWREIPEYFYASVHNIHSAKIIAEWDALVYQAMLTVFLPDILSEGDNVLLKQLKTFTRKLPSLLNNAFCHGTTPVLSEKVRVATDFSKIVKQYYQLNHLALSASSIMANNMMLEQMLRIWNQVDFGAILPQALYVCPNAVSALRLVQESVSHKLQAKANINLWAEWLYAMIEEFTQCDIQNFEEYLYFSQQFIVRWSYVGSLLMREVNEKDKDIFAAFHVVRLFCDEYAKYLVDCKIDDKRRHAEAIQESQWQPPQQQQAHQFNMEVFAAPYEAPHDYLHAGVAAHKDNRF